MVYARKDQSLTHPFFTKGGSSAGRTPPCLKFFHGCIFGNFDFIICINFIVINMQCLQYVFYSLISLQKDRVYVKGHQNNLQTSKIIPRPPVLKFLDPPLFPIGPSFICFPEQKTPVITVYNNIQKEEKSTCKCHVCSKQTMDRNLQRLKRSLTD